MDQPGSALAGKRLTAREFADEIGLTPRSLSF
jgi:hypothetical protein